MRRMIRLFVLLCVLTGVARADLVGYWTFDASNCNDSSGNAYHGTLVGGSYTSDVPAALKAIGMTTDKPRPTAAKPIMVGVICGIRTASIKPAVAIAPL